MSMQRWKRLVHEAGISVQEQPMPTRVYSSQDLHNIGQSVQRRLSMSVLSAHVVSIVRNMRLAKK